MKKLKLSIAAFIAIVGVAVATPVLTSSTVQAQDANSSGDSSGDSSGGSGSTGGSAASKIGEGVNKVGGSDNTVKLEDRIKTITNILLFILGAIAVIVIIIGGIRYATSNGDSSQTKAAKDTILYAVIGLAVAIVAYAIVQFILTAFDVK